VIYVLDMGNYAILGGTVLSEDMRAQGYKPYYGPIPYRVGTRFRLINGVLTVVDDEPLGPDPSKTYP
jgi:hypothetical protein